MDLSIRTSDESTIRLLDGLVAFWFVLWLVIGGWSGYTIWQLSELGDTVTSSGNAIGSAGEALEAVGGVPVVGERPAELGRQVSATGDDVAVRGQQVKSQMRQLSLLLGLAIALMPTTPVLGLYVPLRVGRRREADELRRTLDHPGGDDAVDRYLAERAVHTIPFPTLHGIEEDPWRAIEEGRTRRLADAELSRLGVRRP
jgi:hypothetical protein